MIAELWDDIIGLAQNVLVAAIGGCVVLFTNARTNNVEKVSTVHELKQAIKDLRERMERYKEESTAKREHGFELVQQTLKHLDENLNSLRAEVRKHNKLVERTYKLEQVASIQEEKIKVANHRIEDLEDKHD